MKKKNVNMERRKCKEEARSKTKLKEWEGILKERLKTGKGKENI